VLEDKNMPHNINIIKNFITKEEANECINLLLLEEKRQDPNTNFIFLPGYGINETHKYSVESQKILKNFSNKLTPICQDIFGYKNPIYMFETYLVCMKEGAKVRLHMDAKCKPSERFDLPCEETIFTGIIYLNDNFTGGEIIFPNQEVTYAPEAYSVVLYPAGGYEYPHAVNEILSGKRYCATFWYTGNEKISLKSMYGSKEHFNKELKNIWEF
jgi:hypothetical protein